MFPMALFFYYFCDQGNLKTVIQGNSLLVNKKQLERGRQLTVLHSIAPNVMGFNCKEGYLCEML